MIDENYKPLLQKIGITFKDINLLRQAFIHRSYLNENKIQSLSNERIEFLGDSVLSLIISTHLYIARPQDNEGDLTNLRSFIVKTKSLATAAKKLGLGQYLKLSKGEEMGGGRENLQLLANTFESLIGAIYLDQGLNEVKRVIEENLLTLFQREIKQGPPKDAKSKLQEVSQEKTKESPVYKILETKGPDHAKQFRVGVFIKEKILGEGFGNSKQEAEEMAATKALETIQ